MKMSWLDVYKDALVEGTVKASGSMLGKAFRQGYWQVTTIHMRRKHQSQFFHLSHSEPRNKLEQLRRICDIIQRDEELFDL